jgi:heme/copper-type cytochrome/quinol oxidase subunit 1
VDELLFLWHEWRADWSFVKFFTIMMKHLYNSFFKFFLKAENWLLILPIIITTSERLFFSASTFDIHLHDTYFVIANFHIGILLFLSVCIPYLFHFLLRRKGVGSKGVLLSHVVATIILLLFFFVSFMLPHNDMPRHYYDFSSWELYKPQYDLLTRWLAFAVLAFVVIQLLFIVYGVVRLVAKK